MPTGVAVDDTHFGGVGGVLLLDQLLGALDLVQRDALGRAARLTDPLGMGLPLRFALLVTRRRNEGSVCWDEKVESVRSSIQSLEGWGLEHDIQSIQA